MKTVLVRNTLNGRVHLHEGDALPDTGPIPVLCGLELLPALSDRVVGPYPLGARCPHCLEAQR